MLQDELCTCIGVVTCRGGEAAGVVRVANYLCEGLRTKHRCGGNQSGNFVLLLWACGASSQLRPSTRRMTGDLRQTDGERDASGRRFLSNWRLLAHNTRAKAAAPLTVSCYHIHWGQRELNGGQYFTASTVVVHAGRSTKCSSRTS